LAGPGEVVVRVHAAGLNAADLQQARGDYPAPPGWPQSIPGMEIAGRIEAVGAAVNDWRVGDRVMALVGGGGHAERLAVPADLLMPVPTEIQFTEAAGFPEAFSTAWDGLIVQAGLRAGERVLVTGAAGGVGTAMVQLAGLAGAEVIASARRPRLHDKLRGLTGGVVVVTPDGESEYGPFDVIVELVGAPSCLDRIDWLCPYGRLLVIGVQAGHTVSIRLFDLMLRRGRLLGSTIRARPHREKADLAGQLRARLLPSLAAGRLHIPIDHVFALDAAPAAYQRLAQPGKFGKIILDPS
jgi:NADPH2:quinone reductase